MNDLSSSIHPYTRLFFLVGNISAVLLLTSPFLMLSYYLIYMLPIVIVHHLFKSHLKLAVFGILPVFFSYALIYIYILNSTKGGWDLIALRTFRLLSVTSLIQVTISIPSQALVYNLRKWRFSEEMMLITIGAFTVWKDMSTRMDKIITARFASGIVGKRSFINKAGQVPYLLSPLVIGILRASLERADIWDQKGVLVLIKNFRKDAPSHSLFYNILLCVTTISWLAFSIILAIK